MIPTGRIQFRYAGAERGAIVLSEGHVTYLSVRDRDNKRSWVTCPISDVDFIEWDDFPFQPEGGDEIAFLQQFIANLSPDDLEAAVEAQIGVDGMHRQGEWIKAALLGMVQ